MKKKTVKFILPLLVMSLTGCEPNRTDLKELTYSTFLYGGYGQTSTYNFNFEKNKFKFVESFKAKKGSKVFEKGSFSEDDEEKLYEGMKKCGLFDIESHYSPSGVVFDGGGWTLSLEFTDGKKIESSGDNEEPEFFQDLKQYFEEFCGYPIF